MLCLGKINIISVWTTEHYQPTGNGPIIHSNMALCTCPNTVLGGTPEHRLNTQIYSRTSLKNSIFITKCFTYYRNKKLINQKKKRERNKFLLLSHFPVTYYHARCCEVILTRCFHIKTQIMTKLIKYA